MSDVKTSIEIARRICDTFAESFHVRDMMGYEEAVKAFAEGLENWYEERIHAEAMASEQIPQAESREGASGELNRIDVLLQKVLHFIEVFYDQPHHVTSDIHEEVREEIDRRALLASRPAENAPAPREVQSIDFLLKCSMDIGGNFALLGKEYLNLRDQLASERERAEKAIVLAIENHEAALCPEDMGCAEYIASLVARAEKAEGEAKALRGAVEKISALEQECCYSTIDEEKDRITIGQNLLRCGGIARAALAHEAPKEGSHA